MVVLFLFKVPQDDCTKWPCLHLHRHHLPMHPWRIKVSYFSDWNTDAVIEAEFILFGKVGQQIVGKPLESILGHGGSRHSVGEGTTFHPGRSSESLPPQVARLVSQKYTFTVSIKDKAYSITRRLPSFQVHATNAEFGKQKCMLTSPLGSPVYRALQIGGSSFSQSASDVPTPAEIIVTPSRSSSLSTVPHHPDAPHQSPPPAMHSPPSLVTPPSAGADKAMDQAGEDSFGRTTNVRRKLILGEDDDGGAPAGGSLEAGSQDNVVHTSGSADRAGKAPANKKPKH